HPTKNVGCTEQPPEAQSLPAPAQDSSAEEDPGDKSHHRGVVQVEEGWGYQYVQYLSEEVVLPEGEECSDYVFQTLDLEDSVAEKEPETAEPEAGTDAEQPPPEAIVTQGQQPTPTSDLSPPPSAPAFNPIPEEPSSTPSSSSSVPEETVSDVPNTSNALGKGTKTDIVPPLAQAGQASVGLAQGANTSHMLNEQDLSSHVTTETDPSVATKDPEDNPTFDEWRKKMMEVEKEKTQATHTSTNGGSHAVKKVQKNFNNYASVECGAKILGSNPEAKSTSAILMESMDHYMLNPCSNKIWYPTNKWVKLGTFHARDERTVQSFPLDEHLYAKYVKMFTKYIKLELVSHHGSEHFCPLSLIRVFGTSMVEEYEEIADPLDRPDDQDDDLDYPPGYVPVEDEASNDLIGSAKDVILNMVNNIKVNVLGGGPGEGNFSSQAVNMTTSKSSDPDTTSTVSPVPDTVEVEQSEVPEDPDVTTTEDPTPEPPTPDTPVTEEPKLENLTGEEQVVTPIEKEEVQSIVTMLEEVEEEEEKEEEGRDREVHHCPGLRQQESLGYCGLSSSSSCSCSASFQEYYLHQCSVQRNCTSQEREPEAPPAPGTTTTPSQQLSISPTATHTPQQPHTQGEQPQEREPSSALGERRASPTDAPPHLPWVETEAVGEREPSTELPHLEPSQTSTLPSSTASSATRPTPTVEPPHQASSKDLPGQEHPATGTEKSREVQQEENRQPSPTVATSSPIGPVEQSCGAPVEERPCPEVQPAKQDNIPVIYTQHVADPLPHSLATVSTPTEQQQPPVPTAEKESAACSGNTTPEESRSVPVVVMTEPPSHGQGQAVATETKGEAELVEDILFTSSPNGNVQQLPRPSSPSPSPSDFYAELHKPMEQGNGNPMHGSTSQKESVFMRLNNRIKALEMNMSLSGRYLEQLSQRYRRQMEEMQRAFNKTIIKLQNTSRVAEEQDQRQTESIQSLQVQLEVVTQLVLNLSVGVSERQSYLLLCLVLCLFLGLLLCAQHCRMSAMEPPSTDPEPPIPKSYSYCCPERRFSEYEDMSLKRLVSYPLLHSGSFQLPTTEGKFTYDYVVCVCVCVVYSLVIPNSKYNCFMNIISHRQPQQIKSLSPTLLPQQKKRSKMKAVETLKCTTLCAPLPANGAPVCNGGAPRGTTDPTPRMGRLSHHAFMDPPSECSSESSSQSDEPSLCGLAATTCTRLCDGLHPPRSRAEKRAFKQHRSKPGCVVVDLLQAPRRDATPTIPTLQDLMGGGKELSAGMLGVTAL
ncbi:unnamed protein product, partial [Coregonus sp. 'balchen']